MTPAGAAAVAMARSLEHVHVTSDSTAAEIIDELVDGVLALDAELQSLRVMLRLLGHDLATKSEAIRETLELT